MAEILGEKECDRRKFLVAGGAGLALLAAGGASKLLAREQKKRTRWAFLIDLRKCVGCKACAVTCKTEFNTRLGFFRSSVKEREKGSYPAATRRFVPWLCNHCKKPVCLEGCPVEEIEASFTFRGGETVTYRKRATYQRPDGLVLVDQDRCVGCGACVELCPYQVRFLDTSKKAGGNPDGNPADKCDLCVHRLDKGIVPACVNTCQGRARTVGNLNDPDSEISVYLRDQRVKVLLPHKKTNPQCFYVELDEDAYELGRDTKDERQQS